MQREDGPVVSLQGGDQWPLHGLGRGPPAEAGPKSPRRHSCAQTRCYDQPVSPPDNVHLVPSSHRNLGCYSLSL